MKSILLLCFSFLIWNYSSAQKIESAEYFWDSDPGEGSGISISASDGSYGQSLEKISLSVPTTDLTIGFHILYIRYKGTDGIWGNLISKNVLVRSAGDDTHYPNQKTVAAEYFWDSDPGEGSGTSITSADGSFDQSIEKISVSVPTTDLTIGFHILYVRYKDSEGNWSNPISKNVLIRSSNDSTNYPNEKPVAAEYFLDSDPGEGNGNSISGTFTELNSRISQVLSTSSLTNGNHKMYVRFKNKNGVWGNPVQKLISVTDPTIDNGVHYAGFKIKASEFFLNSDPGEGNGTDVPATDGTANQASEKMSLTNSTSDITEGINTLYYRVKNENGEWSNSVGKIVSILPPQIQPSKTKVNTVVSAEYFIDSDPGENNGFSFDPMATNTVKKFADTLNTSSLSIGLHTLYSRVKRTDGSWSNPSGKSFRVFDATHDIVVSWENQANYDSLSLALTTLGYSFDEWNRSDGNMPYRHWKTVVWDENDNLISAERDSLKSFLSAGNENSLLIAGNEIAAFHRKSGSQQDTVFMEQYLHARYVSTDIMGATNTFQVTGDLINSGEELQITSASADGVRPINGAQAAYHYPSNIKADTVAGVAFGNSNYNVVYFPFAWNETSNLSRLLEGSLNWIATEGATLPVEMSDLSYQKNGNQIILKWETKTETNNAGWEIENRSQETGDRSQNVEWRKIGFISGKGTTTEKQRYSFPVSSLQSSVSVFRLKQIDLDGTFKYSNTIEVTNEIPATFSLEQNYPNPFNPTTTIRFSLPENGKVNLTIFDLLGRQVRQLADKEMEANYQEIRWDGKNDVGVSVSSGIYFYRISVEGISGNKFADTKKMLMMK